MKKEIFDDLQRNPIDQPKYVRDSIKLGSNTKAVMVQKPDMAPATAAVTASRLEKRETIQKLREKIDGRMLKLNNISLNTLEELHEKTQHPKIRLGAVSEARKVIKDYQDRVGGKPKQTVETTSKKLIIHMSMKRPPDGS